MFLDLRRRRGSRRGASLAAHAPARCGAGWRISARRAAGLAGAFRRWCAPLLVLCGAGSSTPLGRCCAAPCCSVVCGCLRGAGTVFSLRAARAWGQSARALHCMTLRTLFDCPRAQKVREATSPLGACGARAINRRGDLQQRLLTTARSRARPARSRRRSSISTRRPRGSGYLPS